MERKSILGEDGWRFDPQEVYLYTCNLCDSKFHYVCEFDLHMRSHTKHGKNVVIFGLVYNSEESLISHKRVSDSIFSVIEKELMKVSGISAVLSICGTDRLEPFSGSMHLDDDMTVAASVLIGAGVDIYSELDDSGIESSIIPKIRVLDVRNHVMSDKSTSCQFQS